MTKISRTHVNNRNNAYIGYVNNLYLNSFPKEEQRPWNDLLSLIDGRLPFFKLYVYTTDNGEFAGFATIWQLPSHTYIEHFAVADNLRSKGIGNAILNDIKAESAQDGKGIVVEVELPGSTPDADRRINFYTRNGFIGLNGFSYYQPPYAPGMPDVQLMLMSTSAIKDPVELTIILHTLVYNQ